MGYDSDDIRTHLKLLEKEGMLQRISKDRYCLAGEERSAEKAHTSTRDVIMLVLNAAEKPLGMKEIAAQSGRKLSTLRAQMARLVAEGTVEATAPVNNPGRKYRKR